jgi:hypothetical protein
MATCPKCNTINEEGMTRCAACKSILPVKIGSKSATRWERVRRLPDLVGTKCPSCGAPNAYTRLRCRACNSSLTKAESRSGLGKLWIYAGIGVVILATILTFVLRHA